METNIRFRKNQFLRIFWVVGITVTVFTACKKDILKTVPQTSILDTKSYSTPAQFLAQVNGLYAATKNPAFYGGGFLIMSELRGEEFLNGSGNTADGAAIYNQNALASADQVNLVWSAGYSAINNVNVFIDHATTTTVINDSVKKIYIAEAKFLRALSYFSLVQFYARPFIDGAGAKTGLPLRLTGITSLVNGDLAPATVSQIYDQVISDLNDAEKDLPVTHGSVLNPSRAHKSTAIALKTRVYLVKQDWANVITEASKIVSATFQYSASGVTHKLESKISDVFAGSYTGSEIVLTFPFNAVDAPGSQRALAYYYTAYKYVTVNPNRLPHTDSLSVFYNAQDARSITAGTILKKSGTQLVLNKFPKTTTPYTDYVPAIRYAEVLLNYAEAAARTNDLTKATDLLNTVRKRSNPNWTFAAADVSTQEALINTILKERRIELLGEGFRVLDILRLLNTIPSKASIPAVAPTDNNYLWPIPSSEKATNSLI